MRDRGLTDIHVDPFADADDPALIYDTLAREREAGEMVFGPQRQDTAARRVGPGSWGSVDPVLPSVEGLAVLARWRAIWAAEGLA